ncbi:T9SS type A sorting domain-containing protein [candidate division TA06 bacterium]|uniref:T9SS type A sorting domain-containing protein n=1 Tax=candidate division TA06 bacterium TaxID=2250710 RepID=A0A523UYV5_UNCT6|nr:MAG: T9SS type A sorting domain-containing protein [candidate division TA06 bacterium]
MRVEVHLFLDTTKRKKEVSMLRRFLSVFVPIAVCFVWTAASFGLTNLWTGQVERMPVILGEGGPDVYGYTWVDSDTAIGPTFSWIDTTSDWIEVTGLFDDNVVGPIPIGFTFPYYWYDSDQIYVGSNGYISLSDRTLEAAAFQPLPDPQRPNDILAPLMDDLDFTVEHPDGPPGCFYWTNAAADTFVISYLTVQFWNSPASKNTFQIILSRPDSTITFQILEQVGPSQSIASRSVGIEDITGTVGLRYLFGFTPPENVIHSNLAILFTPPISSTFQIADAALTDVATPDSRGFIMLPTDSVDLWAKVKNTGNQVATFFDVYCYVMDTLGTYYFGDTATISALNPGDVDSVVFTPSWTPPGEATYFAKAKVVLTDDSVAVNDSSMAEILVVDYPGELSWVDDSLEAGFAWNGTGSGWANKYTPPRYPCLVQSVSAGINSCENPPKNIKVMLMEDDTPDGSPGSILAETTFAVLAGGWFTYNLWPNQNWVFTDGSFFVGYIQLEAGPTRGDPFIGMDYSQPKSRHGWEFTGSWAPHRDNDSMDVALKASVDDAPGPILFEAFATDGPTGGPGIDDDDYVRLEFNAHTNIPTIDQTNIDNILPLSGGHTWLSVDGSLGSAVWSADSTQLIVYLTTSGGVPTVAVGDTVYPDSVTIQDAWGLACKSPRVITGSFEVGIEESHLEKARFVDMLYLARPNPFTGNTRIEYEISSRALTRVRVYDITGRVVATLVEEVKDPGRYSAVWDGTSSGGSRVSSGIYFYRMEAGSFTSTRKITHLK